MGKPAASPALLKGKVRMEASPLPKGKVWGLVMKAPPLVKGKVQEEKQKARKEVKVKGKNDKQNLASGSKCRRELNKNALEKGAPSAMSLREKVQMALSSHEDDHEAAVSELRQGMTKLEKSMVWGQYNTHLKKNKEEKAEYDKMTHQEKGNAQALWFLRKSAPKCMGMKMELAGKDKVIKMDEWCSQRQMLDKFGEDEMQMHLTSGRILWREDPLTKGCWQYRDQGALKREITLEKGKYLNTTQEWEPGTDQDDQFKSLYDSELLGMLGMAESILHSDHCPLAKRERPLERLRSARQSFKGQTRRLSGQTQNRS